MGRAERRAAARGKGRKVVTGFAMTLTLDEGRVVEEALHDYITGLDELADVPDPDGRRAWARERAETIRRGVLSVLEDQAFHDPNPRRYEPTGDREDTGHEQG